MRYQAYDAGTLKVAYCHRMVLHVQTYYRQSQPWLERISRDRFAATLAPYGLHLLDLGADDTDLICQLSLPAGEAVATAASKCKGRLSKWLRATLELAGPDQLLGKGYLAYTVGDTTSSAVTGYLEKQGDHHGYLARPLPPVLVETFPQDSTAHVEAAHSVTLLRYHLVFGTAYRKGIFTPTEARGVLAAWHSMETKGQFSLLKASFVPDHVHLAVQTYPAVKPLALATELMNVAQTVMFEQFPEIIIRYCSNRLWENGCYIGSFGDVASRAVQDAIRRWRRGEASCTECLPDRPTRRGRPQG